jgi:DNA processing protein
VLLSEYETDAVPLAFRFPQRNRLISGLSLVIVVIEASEKSGSLITASWALAQGREVMAVPGNVLSGRNRGGHALIRDGAKIVETADDILEGFTLDSGSSFAAAVVANPCTSVGSGDPALAALDRGRAYDLDELASALGLQAAGLLTRLSDWELRGLVRRLDGGRFMLAS